MRHLASREFWNAYRRLPEPVRLVADKNYALLKDNPQLCNSRKLGVFGRYGLGCAIAR